MSKVCVHQWPQRIGVKIDQFVAEKQMPTLKHTPYLALKHFGHFLKLKWNPYLCASQNARISIVMSVLPICPHVSAQFSLDGLLCSLILGRDYVKKIQICLK